MLNDLRIVEIGEGMAVQVAGLMLSELGADVLKIERPGGDPSRGTAPFANWNRGKRSLVLDLATDEGRATLRKRLDGADALIHQFTPKQAAALGLDDAALAAAFPQLVVCGITGSPHAHPDVERSDDELLVAARLGALYENDGYRAGPIVWRFPAGSWGAAHLAAGGVLARLRLRLETGRGGPAHTSILQGYLVNLPLVWARNSKGPMPNNPPYPLEPRPISVQLFECEGGDWIQIMDPTRQFDYASMPTMWELMAEGDVDTDTDEGVAEAFRRRPRDRWMADLRALDIAAEPAFPLGEILFHDECRANRYVVAVDDPDFGSTIQPNVPFHIEGRPEDVKRPAPRIGEDGERPWAARPSQTQKGADGAPNHAPDQVMKGVKILDCGMFVAGPMAPSLAGQLGADVIKVESLTGDRQRFLHRYFQAAGRSKRSLAIDLTRPEARPVLDRLLHWADLVHHNMRFKGAAKLGLDGAGIHAVNPDVAFNYVSAYGQKGARGDWPGYDSIFNAVGGWEFENAGEGNPPIFGRPGTMDCLTAQSAFLEIAASLYVKAATGEAVTTQTSLFGVAAFTQGEILIQSDGTLSSTFHLDRAQTGFGPYRRLYECADGEWVAIAANSDEAKAATRSVLGGNEARFEEEARALPSEALLAALESAGVPAELVMAQDAANKFFDSAVNRKLGLVSALEQPVYGMVEQPGALWDFGDIPIRFDRACPEIGQHSDEILAELGFSDGEIANLREKKVIV